MQVGYSYTWFNSGTNEVVGTDSVLTVPAGGYYLIVEDDNGCQATDEVFITQHPQLISYTKNDITCHGGNDGQIMVIFNGGGTPPYELDWVNFGNAKYSIFYNLEDGIYDLEIIDANDCVSSLEC